MEHLYGELSNRQVELNEKAMHGEIHKLLLHKDANVKDEIFSSDKQFLIYFENLLKRYSGLNTLLFEPPKMITFLSTLQAAHNECLKKDFDYAVFRKLILDAQGYLSEIFKGVNKYAKF